MSSQGTGQRETMIPNNGLYYIDTTVPKSAQTAFGAPKPPPGRLPECPGSNPNCDVSVFESNKTYHVFLLFANPATTTETFELYVGPSFDMTTLKAETANLNTGAIKFTDLGTGVLPSSWTSCYNSTTGILTVQMNMNFPEFASDYDDSAKNYCQPSSMCSWTGTACQCSITDTNNYLYKDCQADNSAICSWSVKEIDYPSTRGAYGFRFTLPTGFTTSLPPTPNPQPALTGCFPPTAAWNLPFDPASSSVAGSCNYNSSPPAPMFCTEPSPPLICVK